MNKHAPALRRLPSEGGSRLAWVAAASAALLAATALQVNADARRAERAHPPRGRFLRLGGVRLHYLEAGIGAPPIVLLHGNAVSAEDWVASGLFDRLAEHRRVIAFDRPGYGYSARPRDRDWTAEAQAELLAEAIGRLGLERPVVVGHSWGTLPAIALALAQRQAITGLVLLSGYHFPTARPDAVAFSPPAVPVLGDVLRYTAAPLVGRLIGPALVRRMFAPMPVPPAFRELVPLSIMLRPWQIRASTEVGAMMMAEAAAAAPRYPELADLPVRILAGAEDRIVTPAHHAARLHALLPRSELRILPGLGHMLHHGAPGLVAEAILSAGRDPAATPELAGVAG